jgi:hypothetical protein
MGQVWQPAMIDRRSNWDDWVAKGKPSPHDQARKLAMDFFAPGEHQPGLVAHRGRRQARPTVKQYLSEHEPAPLANSKKISEIIAAYEKM